MNLTTSLLGSLTIRCIRPSTRRTKEKTMCLSSPICQFKSYGEVSKFKKYVT